MQHSASNNSNTTIKSNELKKETKDSKQIDSCNQNSDVFVDSCNQNSNMFGGSYNQNSYTLVDGYAQNSQMEEFKEKRIKAISESSTINYNVAESKLEDGRRPTNIHKQSLHKNLSKISSASSTYSKPKTKDPNPDRFTLNTNCNTTYSTSDSCNMSRVGSSASNSLVGTDSNFFLVCAIDFGTTYTSYAFSFKSTPNQIHIMKNSPGQPSLLLDQKMPTSILLDQNGDFLAFGYEAKNMYTNANKVEARTWMFFEKFKMSLYHCKKLKSDLKIKAANNVMYPAIEVFSKTMAFLKSLFLEELDSQVSFKVLEQDIKWVITVPAIWNQESKFFMREAAYMAGLTDRANPHKLVIALEPEAASIYCRKLKIEDNMVNDSMARQRDPINNANANSDRCKNSKYIIVDCGGGTVDISVHELDTDAKWLKEIRRGLGGPFGGAEVDTNFEQLLVKCFSGNTIGKYKEKYPGGWTDLLDNFEIKKRFAKYGQTKPFNIQMPYSLVKFLKKHNNITHKKSKTTQMIASGIRITENGMLRLESTSMDMLINQVTNNIVMLVEKILDDPEMSDVKTMFLVGGFSDSQILRADIKNAFQSTINIIAPADSCISTLKGAVLFGIDPSVVKIRRAACTLGIRSLRKFVVDRDPESLRVNICGIDYCSGIFIPFINVNDTVSSNFKIRRQFKTNPGQKKCLINIYRSTQSNIKYTNDPSIEKLGLITIDLDPFNSSKDILDATVNEVDTYEVANNSTNSSNAVSAATPVNRSCSNSWNQSSVNMNTSTASGNQAIIPDIDSVFHNSKDSRITVTFYLGDTELKVYAQSRKDVSNKFQVKLDFYDHEL